MLLEADLVEISTFIPEYLGGVFPISGIHELILTLLLKGDGKGVLCAFVQEYDSPEWALTIFMPETA